MIPYLGVVFRAVIIETLPIEGDTSCRIRVPCHLLTGPKNEDLTVSRIVGAGGEVLGCAPPPGVSLALAGTVRWVGWWLGSARPA